MFTGLIEDIGRLENMRRGSGYTEIIIRSEKISEDLQVDDSVSVNGICLTVTSIALPYFTLQAVEETLQRSTLSSWGKGAELNLERAVRADGRLGGHIVQGHVDAVAEVAARKELGENIEFELRLPASLEMFCVEKGSITIDGVSLTITEKRGKMISVSLIPHSLNKTIFKDYRRGQRVNIEADILGKYIHEMIKRPQHDLNKEKLKAWGYDEI